MVELGIVFVEILFEDAGAADEERCAGDEEKVQDYDTYNC